MTNYLIIYCHPWNKSFNHAVLTHVTHNLDVHHAHYKIIALYAGHFQPIYNEAEMSLFHSGQTNDPKVTEYLSDLQTSQKLIFITPIWWNDVPGMLKGFFDKVMKEGPGLSHIVTKTGIKGLLTNLSEAYVLTTSTSPTFYLKLFCGNAIQKVFVKTTLKQIGVQKSRWINFGNISNSTLTSRQKYLQYIEKIDF
ncbi:NAD(P)H-dependent oxidoreductase [Companilactobacillus huachuanensis]|uniref:NAD(P)H-dependent oxidoreductase n=1 Tax=Companilactobacillus huachuanensis TaxID=2559914 RepID=A0ABW1RLS1_9LACO|nr:NAD(P)H-dependent oxidoreductase [Companilactobacillus huachuanensis]